MDVTHRTMNAISKRDEAIRRWYDSDTATARGKKEMKDYTIIFDSGPMLLSAVTLSDFDEVKRIINNNGNVNYSNIDGLSSLHQACIDENIEMVKFLLKLGANVNARDNEGWTPLHAASSSGSIDIVISLLENNADVSLVNTDGELALDLADEDKIILLLNKEIEKQKINLDKARTLEHDKMLKDVNEWIKNKNNIPDIRDSQGATPLHVAASKSYLDIIELLIDQLKIDINIRDYDGWTPLHAAVYWKQRESINLLLSKNAEPNSKTNAGIPPMDLADTDMISFFKAAIKKSISTGRSLITNEHDLLSEEAQNITKEPMPHLNLKPKNSSLKSTKLNIEIKQIIPRPEIISKSSEEKVKKEQTKSLKINLKEHLESEKILPIITSPLKISTPKLPTGPPRPTLSTPTGPPRPTTISTPTGPPRPTTTSSSPLGPPRPTNISKTIIENSKGTSSIIGPKLPPSKIEIKVTDNTNNNGRNSPTNKGIKLPPNKSERNSSNTSKSSDSESNVENDLKKALLKIEELKREIFNLTKENEKLKSNIKISSNKAEEMDKLIIQNKRLESENATLIKAMSVYSRNRTRGV